MWKVQSCETHHAGLSSHQPSLYMGYNWCDIYDFSKVWEQKYGKKFNGNLDNQYIVKLKEKGYCCLDDLSLTSKEMSTADIISGFRTSGCEVFYLSGNKPAQYMDIWGKILQELGTDVPFRSTFLLFEQPYANSTLSSLSDMPNCLYNVNIFGKDREQIARNTGILMDDSKERMYWKNLRQLVFWGIPFFITFFGMTQLDIEVFSQCVEDKFVVDSQKLLKNYVEVSK